MHRYLSLLRRRIRLTFDFVPRLWGTIVSNLSFMSHFRYTAHYRSERAGLYVARYAEILESLADQGSFTYAPAAPILETNVDARRFERESWPVADGIEATRITRTALPR